MTTDFVVASLVIESSLRSPLLLIMLDVFPCFSRVIGFHISVMLSFPVRLLSFHRY